jgi:ketosteroid isomerase-like protein
VEPRDFSLVGRQLREYLERLAPQEATGERLHVHSVEQQVDALARGDVASVLARSHPDIQLDIVVPPEFDWIRSASGTEAVRRAIEHNFGAVTEQQPELQGIAAQGESVILTARERGRVRTTGDPYDLTFVQTWTFRDGRLASVRIVAARTGS